MKCIFCPAVFLILMFGSCRTSKDISYFQGIENLTEEQKAEMNQKYVPRICVDDALIISVTSPDRKDVAPFSPPPFGYYLPGESEIGISATTQNLFTYLVDANGEINFPVLGRIPVAGLSINEAIRIMEEKIQETAPGAIVNVQIANFKVSIFGDVRTPNTYSIKTPRLSILDLIAMAGDITILGDRRNVWVHRDNNGEKSYARLDLTDPTIFASPYYYLQQNDIVYVRPNNAQKRNAEYSSRDNVTLAVVSAIISSVSIIVSGILTVRGQNRP